MKTLTMIFWGFLAFHAEAREQWRVERYAEMERAGVVQIGTSVPERRNSWLPRITPGWPVRGGKWLIKWEGTF